MSSSPCRTSARPSGTWHTRAGSSRRSCSSRTSRDYRSLHPQYDFLFNSYYNAVGERHCRPKRGLISRPTVAETYAYRAYVDEHMEALLARADDECSSVWRRS